MNYFRKGIPYSAQLAQPFHTFSNLAFLTIHIWHKSQNKDRSQSAFVLSFKYAQDNIRVNNEKVFTHFDFETINKVFQNYFKQLKIAIIKKPTQKNYHEPIYGGNSSKRRMHAKIMSIFL